MDTSDTPALAFGLGARPPGWRRPEKTWNRRQPFHFNLNIRNRRQPFQLYPFNMKPSLSRFVLIKWNRRYLSGTHGNVEYLSGTFGNARYLSGTFGNARYLSGTFGNARYLSGTFGNARFLSGILDLSINVHYTRSRFTTMFCNPNRSHNFLSEYKNQNKHSIIFDSAVSTVSAFFKLFS